MTFLHASLLLGCLAAAVPVLLHMLGRRQPKPIMFPAIRFVRETAISAQRGWSIKRWLLLALRVLVVLILAAALASPRVHSNMFASYVIIGLLAALALLASAAALTAYGAKRGMPTIATTALIAIVLWGVSGTWLAVAATKGQAVPLPSASGPICVAVVMDTSPSMGYLYHNVTRLDQAKEMARWLMDRLPLGSQIAIVNNDAGVRLNQDRVSANRQLDRTIVEGRATNLIQRISDSIDALRKSELERREIYVLTDLSKPAWREADASDVAKKLAKGEDGKGLEGENVLLQIIDVSAPANEIRNWSLSNLKLSQQSTAPGSQVTITADVNAASGSGTAQMTVELVAEAIDRNLTPRDGKLPKPATRIVDQQLVEIADGGSLPVRLNLKELSEGTTHAELRLSRPDPLEIDNIYYLSIDARTQGQTLVVADSKTDGELVGYAIHPEFSAAPTPAPDEEKNSKTPSAEAMFKWETPSQIGFIDLSRYSSIVLFNPSSLSADSSEKLARWVEEGGGLMIVLSSGFATAEAIMNDPIHELLPGQVKRITRRSLSDRSVSLVPAIKTHPIWTIFERPIDEIPWVRYAVFRHWDLEDLDERSSVLMRFTGSELPAIVEQVRKKGRILTYALPYPEPTQHTREQSWSELYEDWIGFALFQGSLRYLASWQDQQLNYWVDEPATLDNNISQFPQVYALYNPIGEDARVESSDETLLYPFTRYPGQYRLRGLRPQGPVVRGFSVNVNRQDISLERVSSDILTQALGKGQYLIAKEQAEVQSSLGEGRYGRDLAPFLLMIFVMMMMAEQTMASRFYAQSRSATK